MIIEKYRYQNITTTLSCISTSSVWPTMLFEIHDNVMVMFWYLYFSIIISCCVHTCFGLVDSI